LIFTIWTKYGHLTYAFNFDLFSAFACIPRSPSIFCLFDYNISLHTFEGFWGYCSIAFFQQVASVGNNIAIQIAAGSSLKVRQSQNANTGDIFVSFSFWLVCFLLSLDFLGWGFCSISMQAVYKYFHKDGDLTLQHFIIFFGAFELVLSQLPDIHSLRWVNALCTFSTIGFAATTIGVTIYDGRLVIILFALFIVLWLSLSHQNQSLQSSISIFFSMSL
jgi:hypothetical protein